MPDQTPHPESPRDPDGLDLRLRGAAPEVTDPRPEVRAELERMARAARTENRPVRRRPVGRAAAIGLASALVLGGGAAAATTVGDDFSYIWTKSPWAQVDVAFPDGSRCDVRVGGISAASVSGRDHIRDFLTEGGLEEGLDLRDMDQLNDWFDFDETAPESEERARTYSVAKMQAIHEVFQDELVSAGFERQEIGFYADQSCPGADWMSEDGR
ncbi:hypothetical protein BJH93_15650 [Kocuria polaris]|nr:hypothetical protein [Kocuria polaris]